MPSSKTSSLQEHPSYEHVDPLPATTQDEAMHQSPNQDQRILNCTVHNANEYITMLQTELDEQGLLNVQLTNALERREAELAFLQEQVARLQYELATERYQHQYVDFLLFPPQNPEIPASPPPPAPSPPPFETPTPAPPPPAPQVPVPAPQAAPASIPISFPMLVSTPEPMTRQNGFNGHADRQRCQNDGG